MPAGREVGVGVIKLVPSSFDGKALGKKIGDDISDGVNDSVKGDANVERNSEQLGSRSGASFGKGFKGAVSAFVTGAAFAGVLSFGKQAFGAASDLNESVSKAQVVFGDAFATIDAQAQNAAQSLGMSRQQALEAAGTFGNLFRAMGIGVDTSADMSTKLIQLAADLASFNNANPEDVLLALKSGLVGETEPLRQFGVNLNEARIKAEALRLGLVKGNVNLVDVQQKQIAVRKATEAQNKALKEGGVNSQEYKDAVVDVAAAEADLRDELAGKVPELTAAEKAQSAYSLILQDTSLAQGDYERTADGAANTQRTLSAEWDNFTAKVGQFLLPVGQTVLGVAKSGLEGLQGWLDEHGDSIVDWFHKIFGEDPGANFQAGLDIINGKLDEIFGEDKLANFQTGADILRTTWDGLWEDFENGAIEVERVTGPIFDNIGRFLIWLKDEVLDPLWGTIQGMVVEGIPGLAETFGSIIDPFEWIISQGAEQLVGAVQDIGDAFVWFKDEVLDPIIGVMQTVIDKVSSLVDWLGKLQTNPVGAIGDIGRALGVPGFADGGVVPGMTGQPRLVLAHGGETILPTHQAAWAGLRGAQLALAAAPSPQTFGDINVTGVQQPWETAYAIRSVLRAQSYLAGGR